MPQSANSLRQVEVFRSDCLVRSSQGNAKNRSLAVCRSNPFGSEETRSSYEFERFRSRSVRSRPADRPVNPPSRGGVLLERSNRSRGSSSGQNDGRDRGRRTSYPLVLWKGRSLEKGRACLSGVRFAGKTAGKRG